MSELKERHQEASNYMQLAMVAAGRGNVPESLRLYELAFEAEKQAALLLWDAFEKEPTRSILFRSAAWLAMNCKKYVEAQKMVHLGLAGNPPQELIHELKDVYDCAHQELKLVEMPAASVQTVAKKLKSNHYFWLKGTLTVADARHHQIIIVLDDNKMTKINVPKELMEMVRNHWNEYVSAYVLKQGKLLTLVEMDKVFMQKTA